jgi:hypothetical protein
MKTTTVPAQITTIEDKIAGNLTLQQIILMGGPIFIDFAIYVALPHTLKLNAYKLILMVIVTASANILAIRVKSKILLIWALTIFRYNARPRYYVFRKSSPYLRNEAPSAIDEPEPQTTSSVRQATQQDSVQLSEEDIFKLERILENPSTDLSFTTSRKGGLHVSISEVE